MLQHWIHGLERKQDGALELAHRALELRLGTKPRRFDGARLASVFLNPSLRTKTSMDFAASALGAHMVSLEPGTTSWGWECRKGVTMNEDKAEHLIDAVGVLSEMADLLAVRSFASLTDKYSDSNDITISTFVQHSSKPVINLESALFHPLQGLADTATWIDHLGTNLQNKSITLTWAPHPKALPTAVANQVLLSAALQGMDITLTHPKEFSLPPFIMDKTNSIAESHGGSFTQTHDQNQAFSGAQVIVAKSWSGWEGYENREEESYTRKKYQNWIVNREKMDLTNQAGFMHCLPVRRNVVVSDEVIDGENSWTKQTAGLRMWTAMALLEKMLGEI